MSLVQNAHFWSVPGIAEHELDVIAVTLPVSEKALVALDLVGEELQVSFQRITCTFNTFLGALLN